MYPHMYPHMAMVPCMQNRARRHKTGGVWGVCRVSSLELWVYMTPTYFGKNENL